MSAIYINGKDSPPLENPLARFKSYSYYHVLAVCDSSSTADALSEQRIGALSTGVVDAWLHKTQSSAAYTDQSVWDGRLGPWAPRSIIQHSFSGGPPKVTDMKYCILINGATDADMVISKVTLQTLAAAGAVNNDMYTSLAVEGTMEISEPKGITFLDLVARCCVALGKDAAHVTFLLKTFFVGVNDAGDIETIADITPVPFVITEATGSFTEAGGQYNIQFVAVNDGVSRLPQYDKMVHSPVIKAGSLASSATALQEQVTRQYEDMYRCVSAYVESKEKSLGYEPGQITKSLRRVKYVVEVDKFYDDPAYEVKPGSEQQSDTGCGTTGSTTAGTDFSLESALHQMMKNCPRAMQDMQKGLEKDYQLTSTKIIKAGQICGYKIHTRLDTSAASISGDQQLATDQPSHIVTYRIVPFPEPKDMMNMNEADRETFLTPNTIEFDYLYTGKNIDILEFDMKVNMGLAYLQIATLTNTYKDQGTIFPAMATLPDIKQVVNAQDRIGADTPVEIPVFFSTNLELPAKRTTQDLAAQSTAAYTMAKHSSLEVLDVSMKITGNLTLLKSTVQTVHPKDSTLNDVTQWGYIPSFAKIHIKMPSNNDDIGLFGGEYKNQYGYATDFWFQGYYYMLGIEHVFDDGEFTQNVSMVGMPDPIVGQIDKKDKAKTTEDSSDIIADCYTNNRCADKKPAKPSNNGASTKSDVVTQSPAAKTAKKQVFAQLPPGPVDTAIKSVEADGIVGWKKMNPEVRAAIVAGVGEDKNIKLSTYAAIAAIESGGNPGAVSSTGAKGIFQFTTSTWNETMPGHKLPASPDPRNDPHLNAVASRIYLNKISKKMGGTTDPTLLYMGHNLGYGAGPAAYIEQQKGSHMTMKDLYAAKGWNPQWPAFARANGYTQDATVDNIRDQVAAKFLRVLVDKSVVDQSAQSQTPADVGASIAKTDQTPKTTLDAPANSGTTGGDAAKSNSAKCALKTTQEIKDEAKKKEKAASPCGKDTSPGDGWSLGKGAAFGGPKDYILRGQQDKDKK